MDIVQILNHLKEWDGPIESLRHAFYSTTSKKSKGKKMISNMSTADRDIVLPDNPSPEAISAYNDIHTLWRALRHATSANLQNILSHTELITSSISWFAQVSYSTVGPQGDAHRYFGQHHADFPESAEQLGIALREYVHSFWIFCLADLFLVVPSELD